MAVEDVEGVKRHFDMKPLAPPGPPIYSCLSSSGNGLTVASAQMLVVIAAVG